MKRIIIQQISLLLILVIFLSLLESCTTFSPPSSPTNTQAPQEQKPLVPTDITIMDLDESGETQTIDTITHVVNEKPSIAIQFLVDDTKSVFDFCGLQVATGRYTLPTYFSRTFKYLSKMEISTFPDIYLGVASFSSRYEQLFPLTEVSNISTSMIEELNKRGGIGYDEKAPYTDFTEGLKGAHESLKGIKNKVDDRFIVMITDGKLIDSSGLKTKGDINDQLELIKSDGIGVFIGLLCPSMIDVEIIDNWKALKLELENIDENHLWDTEDQSEWGLLFMKEIINSRISLGISGWVQSDKKSEIIHVPGYHIAKVYRFSFPDENQNGLILSINGKPTLDDYVPLGINCDERTLQLIAANGPGFYWIDYFIPEIQARIRIVPSINMEISNAILNYQFPNVPISEWVNIDRCLATNISSIDNETKVSSNSQKTFTVGIQCDPLEKLNATSLCRKIQWIPTSDNISEKYFGEFSWRFSEAETNYSSMPLNLKFLYKPEFDPIRSSIVMDENDEFALYSFSFNYLPENNDPSINITTDLKKEEIDHVNENLRSKPGTPETKRLKKCEPGPTELVNERDLSDKGLDWNQAGYQSYPSSCSVTYRIQAYPHFFRECGYDTIRFSWEDSEMEELEPTTWECHLSTKITCKMIQ